MYGVSPLKQTGPLKDYDVRPELHHITNDTAPGGVLIINGKYDTAQDEVMMPFFTNIRARVK
jgi:L-proline amide hydrolase